MDHAVRVLVKAEVTDALKKSYSFSRGHDANLNTMSDAILALLYSICGDVDRYHMFVGYLNNLRLEQEKARPEERKADG
jgi:hypothetical protein